MPKKIKVKLFSTLKRYGSLPNGIEHLEIPEHDTVGCLKERYGFLPGEVGLVIVNNKIAQDDQLIPDGSLIEIFPPFAGG